MSWSHVQTATNGTFGSPETATFSSAVTNGNCVIGTVQYTGTATTSLSSVKDNLGNSLTIVDNVFSSGDSAGAASFIVGNVTNGMTGVTCTATGNQIVTIVIDEYSGGAALANPTDVHTGQLLSAPGANPISSGNVTTTVANDGIWGAYNDLSGNSTSTQGSGFTKRGNVSDGTILSVSSSEDNLSFVGPGTTAATWSTSATNNNFILFVIAVKPAATGTVVEEDNSQVPRRYWSGWTPNANLLKNTAQDTSSNAAETNPHWRPWTLPPQWLLNRNLIQHRAQDESSNAAETNIHFIPRAFPPQWTPTARLIIHRAQDESSNAAETNIHTVFKTWPVQWTPFSLLRAVPNDAPLPVQAETNTFFIPRTLPPQWRLQASLKQNTAQDTSSNAAETNPHWLGKTWPVQWVTFLLTRAPATDAPVPAQPETNTFFIPRTYLPQWVPQASLRQNTAQDLSSLGTATNTFFIPRTWPAQWNLQASLMRGTAQDFSSTPPAVVAVYARYGAAHGIGMLSAIPGEVPS